MLKHLYIKNYALFAETHVDFPAGLNILTGETGAGKSLLVGALGLIMGKRADNSAIFFPDRKCIIEAEFGDLSPRLRKELTEQESFDMEEKSLLIRREIRINGKSRAFINDTPVSLQELRKVADRLLDLHDQHDHLDLLAADRQIFLLDAFAECSAPVAAFAAGLSESQRVLREIKTLEAREAQSRQQLEFTQFQLNELKEAGISAGEEEQLEQELNLLQNSEEIREALGMSVDRLYEQEDVSLYEQLSEVLEPLQKVAGVNKLIASEVSRLTDALNTFKDSAYSLKNLLETVESDPERLSFIEERLAVYHSLKLKYGVKTGEELIAKYEELQNGMEEFDSLADRIVGLGKEHAKLMKQLGTQGLAIEKMRFSVKKDLENRINALLKEVGFQDAHFEVVIERLKGSGANAINIEGESVQPGSRGINLVSFLIRTNPGLPVGPLSQIASGGEISRVMLAIKTVLADKSEFPVLIFDEIDVGISGEIAKKVGDVMKRLGEKFQILSITHLPQIAGKGHQHFMIRKQIQGETTVSSVHQLSHEERINELAKMISGEDPTESALRNATELIS